VFQKLQVSGHKLTGRLSQSLFKSVALQIVYFHSNEFQGTIAEAISNLLNLAYFSVVNNKMNGTLPASMKALTKLSTLGLAENSFSGTIDPIAGLPNLIILFLRHKLFDGVIPLLAGCRGTSYSTVAVFDMDSNQFTKGGPWVV
jgi:Leucine-rich repeat (LRR) protein